MTTRSKNKHHSGRRTAARKVSQGTAPTAAANDATLIVSFDRDAKTLVQRAAASRGLSVSDYVSTRIIHLARQDIAEADTGVLRLPREDQIVFWQALQRPPTPTAAQRSLRELVSLVM